MKSEKGERISGISRREFIERSGRAFAGAILGAVLNGDHDALAWSVEINEDDSFREGVLKFKHEVFFGEREVAGTYRLRADGKGSWVNLREGERTRIDTNEHEEVERLKIYAQERDKKIIFLHTHPLRAAAEHKLISEELVQTARKGTSPASFQFPPSFSGRQGASGDDVALVWRALQVGKRSEVVQAVADPSGLWTRTVNLESHFMEDYVVALWAEWIKSTNNKPYFAEGDIPDRLRERLEQTLPSYATRDLFRSKYGLELDDVKDALDRVVRGSLKGEKPDPSRLIDAHQSVGMNLTFTPYDQVKEI